MAERNQEYTANKRALARSLERERALRDSEEELQVRIMQLQDEYNILDRELQVQVDAAAVSARSPSIFSVFSAAKSDPPVPETDMRSRTLVVNSPTLTSPAPVSPAEEDFDSDLDFDMTPLPRARSSRVADEFTEPEPAGQEILLPEPTVENATLEGNDGNTA